MKKLISLIVMTILLTVAMVSLVQAADDPTPPSGGCSTADCR
jgi:hypothetical protein